MQTNNTDFRKHPAVRGAGLDAARFVLAAASILVAAFLSSCQSAAEPSFPANPTDSGSRYSDFNLPGSNMGMQNTDLED